MVLCLPASENLHNAGHGSVLCRMIPRAIARGTSKADFLAHIAKLNRLLPRAKWS
jgi:hypothetical protein